MQNSFSRNKDGTVDNIVYYIRSPFYFETEFHQIAQARLELAILLPPPAELLGMHIHAWLSVSFSG